jgi:hypothetical protein
MLPHQAIRPREYQISLPNEMHFWSSQAKFQAQLLEAVLDESAPRKVSVCTGIELVAYFL